jgi:hypothetical protein
LLLERWNQVKDGHGQVVLLSGEGGIGKPWLVQVLKEHVAEQRHTQWECRSSPYYQNTALYPITELFQRTLQWQSEDEADERAEVAFCHALDIARRQLIRSTARGAVSLERLEADANGDLLSTFTRPWSDGTIGITLAPLERLEKLAALVPLPRLHLVRYGGCLAPHSQLRRLITPTLGQQGVAAPEAGSASPHWSWARLLKRVFACDLEHCPACGRGTLRLIATLTQADVLRTMLRPLTRAAEPPPLAEARVGQATCAWASPEPDSAFSHVPWGPVVAEGRPRRVPPAASGEHERVRDVSQVRRRGGSGQRGGF